MHSLKWLLVLELYVVAVGVSLTGDEWSALVFAIGATIALLVALELGADLGAETEHGLSVDRLRLVNVYARLPQCPFDLLAQDDGPRWRLYLPCQLRAGHVGAHYHPTAAMQADPGMTTWSLTGSRGEASA